MGMRRFSGPKTLLFFYLFDIVLVLAVLVLVVPQKVRNRSPEFMQESLIGKEDFAAITKIEVKNRASEKNVTLKKIGETWTGTDSDSSNSFFWPADKALMEKFFRVVSKEQKAEVRATKHSSLAAFDLDDIHATSINFTSSKGSVACYLFGKTSADGTGIYFRKWGGNTVWEIDGEIAEYIEENGDFWCDPYLFPQYLTGFSKGESESLLRHGKMFHMRPPSSLEPVHRIRRTFMNGASADFSVYQKEDLYIVIPVFHAGIGEDSETSEGMSLWNYRYEISEITLEKFLNEISE